MALRRLAEHDRRLDPGRLDGLIERADQQSDTLEQLRLQTVAEVPGELVDRRSTQV